MVSVLNTFVVCGRIVAELSLDVINCFFGPREFRNLLGRMSALALVNFFNGVSCPSIAA